MPSAAVAAYPELTYIVLDESDTFQNVEGETNNCCIAVREGSTELVDILNGALEAIDNTAGTGAVYVDGKTWTARSLGGEPIPAGTLVRAQAVEGVKLMVTEAAACPSAAPSGLPR